jgi:dipeptidyl aminopeptidase/acylaminoacyl peptidase
LVAQSLNVSSLELEGQATIVAPDAAPGSLVGPPGRFAQFSASTTGVLAVTKTRGGIAGQLTWFDRAGKASSSIAQPTGVEYLNPAISPDGNRVALNRMDSVTGNWDIWVLDLARNVASRLTSDPASDSDPVWSADGKEIVFASNRGGQFGVYRKAVDRVKDIGHLHGRPAHDCGGLRSRRDRGKTTGVGTCKCSSGLGAACK